MTVQNRFAVPTKLFCLDIQMGYWERLRVLWIYSRSKNKIDQAVFWIPVFSNCLCAFIASVYKVLATDETQ